MTKAPLAAYPALRLRRLRQADWIRRLVRETVLTPADLIWSMVVHEGEGTGARPSPSCTTADQMKSAGVSVVSRTRRRIQSAWRSRRRRSCG